MKQLTIVLSLLSALLLSGCSVVPIEVSYELKNGIKKIDVGSGVFCYYTTAGMASMSCVYIPTP